MKRVERNHQTVFVIGDTTEHVEKTCAFLSEHFGKCEILGAEAFENCQGGTDAMVNEINALTFDTKLARCQGCTNHCLLTINRFCQVRIRNIS
jgi:N-acetylglucosaminyldiphosphoundecaprenol N-acetyl-beta-D-mannosaminyltransferase